MCTALLSIEPGLPTLLVGVRDELVDRSWEPPGWHWPDRPELIGGRDLKAGGTWLAVAPEQRRAACVLNARGQQAPPASRRSRGELPLAAANGQELDQRQLPDFDPFHLLTVEPGLAFVQSWDGATLIERTLPPGLHLAVNSGWASDLASAPLAPPSEAGGGNGRALELARIAHFLPKFTAAARPSPQPGQPVTNAWGDWLTLINGDGLASDDDRALILCHDLGDGRIFGSTSVSLVALWPGTETPGLRYDFTAKPGDPAAWYSVLG
jgi:hypothetical protein